MKGGFMSTWDLERGTQRLPQRAWDDGGVASLAAACFQAEADAGALADAERDELDIAGWPALVAPFYD
jgi:hypothetical protein